MKKIGFSALILFYLISTHNIYSKTLEDVTSWLYQLQDVDLAAISETDYDLIVMDYSKYGSDATAFSKAEIESLQKNGEKIVLAYLSIGEAEDYRYYWQEAWTPGNPLWLDQENPDWVGNYKVLYWHEEWQSVIFEYLDKILDAGFDGVYLDLIDAYESYLHISSVQTPLAMANFVKAIRDTARIRDPDFYIIGQNAAELVDWVPEYKNYIDGIGQEDLHYGYEKDGVATSTETIQEIQSWLDIYLTAGRIVLTIDYPFGDSEDIPHFDAGTVTKIKDAYKQSRDKGYIPYCTVRNLNYLTMNPGHNYSYYVDQDHPDAGNENPGTEALPWKTIQNALDILFPGEIVYIKEGIYAELLLTARSGVEGKPIVLKAFGENKPVIDGINVSAASTALRIEHDYITVNGLEIKNWNTGIWIDNAGWTEISDCEIHKVWYGIGAANGTHDFLIEGTEIHHFVLYGFDASPSGGAPCFNGTLNNCIAHTGSDPEQNVDGFAFGHGNQHNFTLTHCTTYDVFDGFDISARNTTLNGCIAYGCGWGGVKIWQDSVKLVNCLIYNNNITNIELDWDNTPGTTELIHCTLYNGGTWNINAYDNPSDKLKIYNCIVAGGDNVGILIPETNYQGDYNLFHIDNPPRMIGGQVQEYSLQDIESGKWTQNSGQDSHSVAIYSDTSLFVDEENFDFHLQKHSPAINTGGMPFTTVTDFDSIVRPIGNHPDIGAFEFGSSTEVNKLNSGILDKFVLNQNYPNPFNSQTSISFLIPQNGDVIIQIYNLKGQLIWEKFLKNLKAGQHIITWEGQNQFHKTLPSGVYTIQLSFEKQRKTQKLILLK